MCDSQREWRSQCRGQCSWGCWQLWNEWMSGIHGNGKQFPTCGRVQIGSPKGKVAGNANVHADLITDDEVNNVNWWKIETQTSMKDTQKTMAESAMKRMHLKMVGQNGFCISCLSLPHTRIMARMAVPNEDSVVCFSSSIWSEKKLLSSNTNAWKSG